MIPVHSWHIGLELDSRYRSGKCPSIIEVIPDHLLSISSFSRHRKIMKYCCPQVLRRCIEKSACLDSIRLKQMSFPNLIRHGNYSDRSPYTTSLRVQTRRCPSLQCARILQWRMSSRVSTWRFKLPAAEMPTCCSGGPLK